MTHVFVRGHVSEDFIGHTRASVTGLSQFATCRPLKAEESPASVWYAQVGATDNDVNNTTVETSSKNLKVSLKRKRYQNVTLWDLSVGTVTSPHVLPEPSS